MSKWKEVVPEDYTVDIELIKVINHKDIHNLCINRIV